MYRGRSLTRAALEKGAQFARPRRMAQLAQRLRFDLANPFARDREALTDFLERVLAAVADAEPHLDRLLLARRQRLQDRLGLLLQVQVDHRFGRRDHLAILDEVAKMRIFLFADRRLERDRLLRDLQHLADLGHRDVHPLGDLFGGRLATELLDQRAGGANQLVDRLDHVDRDADRARLVGDRAGDRLADPPRRIGRELVAAAVLELVDRLHQADVAFLNQIEELQAAIRVLLRDRDDEAEVGFNELLLRHLRFVLAVEDDVERLLQLVGRLLQRVGEALDLELQLLDLPLDVLLVVFLELDLLVLRVEHPLEGVDLALHRLDALDGVLHLVDQAALDRFGELDLADRIGDVDQRAHRLPPALAVFPLVPAGRPLRRFLQLLVELFVNRPRLAHRVDLFLDLLRALDDPLVGDLLVVEDHQFADRPLAAVQLIAKCDDLAGDQRRAGDRLDHRQLAALDAAGDFDLAFAGEQRYGAHLAQVHADRVVGLVEGARREIELELFGAFRRPIDRLDIVAQVLLIGVDDFDPGAAERVEQIIELVRRGDFRRQKLVHLVVEKVALLLADVDELPHLVVLLLDGEVLTGGIGWSGRRIRLFFHCHSY